MYSSVPSFPRSPSNYPERSFALNDENKPHPYHHFSQVTSTPNIYYHVRNRTPGVTLHGRTHLPGTYVLHNELNTNTKPSHHLTSPPSSTSMSARQTGAGLTDKVLPCTSPYFTSKAARKADRSHEPGRQLPVHLLHPPCQVKTAIYLDNIK